MTRIAFAPALAALTLFVPSVPAQDVATERVRALNEAAQAQELTPRELRDDAWRENRARTLYHLGRALLEVDAGDSSPAYYRDRAIAAFEELVFFAGEGSPMALHAYVGIADVHAARGAWEDAAHFYRAVAVELLGEEGSEPTRLGSVPEPRIEEPVLEEPDLEGARAGDPVLDDFAPGEAPDDLRAHLRAGDLHAREEDWEAAARAYAEIVRQLAE